MAATNSIQQLRVTFKEVLSQLVRHGMTHRSKNDLLLQLLRLSEYAFQYGLGQLCTLDDFFKTYVVNHLMTTDLIQKTKNKPLTHICRVGLLLTHSSRTLRATCLRVLRYYIIDGDCIKSLSKYGIQFFIGRALEYSKSSDGERAQAVKLIRRISEVDPGSMPRFLVTSLVAFAEQANDPLSRVALESLCEFTLKNPDLAAQCGAIKTLCLAAVDPLHEKIQDVLVICLLFLVDDSKTRSAIRPVLDLALLWAPLTAFLMTSPEHEKTISEREGRSKNPEVIAIERKAQVDRYWRLIELSFRCLISFVKSWTGMIALCSDSLGLRSLVDTLAINNPKLQEHTLAVICEILRINFPRGAVDPFRLPQTQIPSEEGTKSMFDLPSRSRATRHNLLNNYTAALLLALHECGLVETLIKIASLNNEAPDITGNEVQPNKIIANKALYVLGEYMNLTTKILPPAFSVQLQSLPSLLVAANDLHNPILRYKASGVVAQLRQYAQLKGNQTTQIDSHYSALLVTGANKWRRVRGKDRRTDLLEDVKMKLDVLMDENTLRVRVTDSGVLQNSDYRFWKWEIVSELLEGPLTNPAHMLRCLQNGFVKRLLSFLKPRKLQFSKISSASAGSEKYVRIACTLIEVMINNEAAYQVLTSGKLLPSIADMLKQEAESRGSASGSPAVLHGPGRAAPKHPEQPQPSDSLLSNINMLRTLSKEYFTIIGTLSSSLKGLQLMNQFKMFEYLAALVVVPGREDLTNRIITSLDYNIGPKESAGMGQSRYLLRQAMRATSPAVRFHAIRHLLVLLRSGVTGFSQWGIKRLAKQLSDSDARLGREALKILDEACDDPYCLDSLLDRAHKLNLSSLGRAGRDLNLRLLSSPKGFRVMSENGSIREQMNLWVKFEYVNYTTSLETSMADAFLTPVWRDRFDQQPDTVVHLPPHFFGELAKTSEGCALLEQAGHVRHFIDVLHSPNSKPTERRGALWVLGHVGASVTGIQFLLQHQVIPMLVDIAESSQTLSLRGTCFMVLGMIAQTEAGREQLRRCNWAASEASSSVAVPMAGGLARFFRVPSYKWSGEWISQVPWTYCSTYNDDRALVLQFIGDLACKVPPVLAKAEVCLKKLRSRYPHWFRLPDLAWDVFSTVEVNHFDLKTRRALWELFGSVQYTLADLDRLANYKRQSANGPQVQLALVPNRLMHSS